jgi:hypothetical protein
LAEICLREGKKLRAGPSWYPTRGGPFKLEELLKLVTAARHKILARFPLLLQWAYTTLRAACVAADLRAGRFRPGGEQHLREGAAKLEHCAKEFAAQMATLYPDDELQKQLQQAQEWADQAFQRWEAEQQEAEQRRSAPAAPATASPAGTGTVVVDDKSWNRIRGFLNRNHLGFLFEDLNRE